MKRNLVLLTLAALLLAGACATTAPTTRGVLTDVNGNTITVAADGAQPANFTLTRGTQVWWQSGLEAQQASLAEGQRVQVWANEGTATRILIEY